MFCSKFCLTFVLLFLFVQQVLAHAKSAARRSYSPWEGMMVNLTKGSDWLCGGNMRTRARVQVNPFAMH